MSFSRHLFNVILQRKGHHLLPNGTHCRHYPLLWQFLRTNGSSLDSMESGEKMDRVVQSEARKIAIEISSTPFDTFVMNNELKKLGFSPLQAEGLVSILLQLSTQQKDLTSLVTPQDLNLLELNLKREIELIKSSQVLMESTSIAKLKDNSEDLKLEITRLKDMLKDEISNVENGVRLDINLERSRNKEQETLIDQKIKDTHNRIGTEVALMKIAMESNKLDLLKYLTGGIITLVTIMVSIVMGIWRLSK